MSAFKDDNQKVSALRIGFFFSMAMGTVLILAGIVAAFKSVSGHVDMISNGTMLMSASGFAKAIQSYTERK